MSSELSHEEAEQMPSRRRFIVLSGAAALAAGMNAPRVPAFANVIQGNARILVGFPAGASPDVAARLVAEYLTDYAPSRIVDNRPGAGGRLALDALKNSKPDGTVMTLTPGDQLALFPHVYAKLGYDPVRDFAPVSAVCSVQFLLTVGPLVPREVKTLTDFMAWCRANPTLATFGSPGEGTRPHFMGVNLARSAGAEVTHVAYKGGPPVVQDLLGSQIAAAVSVVSNVLPHVQAGTLRALATTAPSRSLVLPDVPTAREAGFPALEGVEWFGVFVPAGTPDEIVLGLNAAVRKTLATEAVKAAFANQSFDPIGSTPSELGRRLQADLDQWATVVKVSGFKPMD
jgi:tripartite-type tricarboxylate transporter receptor subunit TctC